MPVIRHWFHVSHDINSDGEVWELTDKFGVAGLRLWLEFLSIADRNEGGLPPLSDSLMRQLSIRCNTTQTRVRLVCKWCETRAWIVSDPTPRLRNWATYNPFREHKKRPSASSPNHPNQPPHPNHPKKIREDTSFEAKDRTWPCPELLIKKYNAETPDELPAVEKVTPARIVKAKSYLKIFPDEDFWTAVFVEITRSPFLRGLKASNGHGSFCADFDWLLTKGKDGTENAVKVFEGKYRNG